MNRHNIQEMQLQPISNIVIANRLKATAFLALLVLCLSGCLDAIEIKTPQGEESRLVVQGKLIIAEPAQIEVRVSQLFDFTTASTKPVNVRSAQLLDENGNVFDITDQGLGNYASSIPADHPNFKVEVNKNYWIRVVTFDNRVFESSMDKGYAVPKPDSLSFKLIQKESLSPIGELRSEEFIQYNINTPLGTDVPNPDLYLAWETQWTFKVTDSPRRGERAICYVTQPLGVTEVKLFDPGNITSDYLEEYSIYEGLVVRQYGEGLYFTAIQESLSESAFTYFKQVTENSNRTGNMFEAPPGAIFTNIRNIDDENDLAYGIFYVTQQDTIRTFVSPESVGATTLYCPPPGGLYNESGYCVDIICCDCRSAENSTTTIPDFWEE